MTIEEAKKILGDKALNKTDEQILSLISLAEIFLEMQQKRIFNGKTLEEVLTTRQKGELQ